MPLRTRLFDEAFAIAKVEALRAKLAFLQRKDVTVDMSKARIAQLGKLVNDLQVMKGAVPPNRHEVRSSSWGFLFFGGSSHQEVNINNDQARQMYQSQIDQLQAETDEHARLINASEEEKQRSAQAVLEQLQTAEAEKAKAVTAVGPARTLFVAAEAQLNTMLADLQTTNLESLRHIEQLARGLTRSVKPVMQFAAKLKVRGEMLQTARDNFHMALFFETIAEFAVMAAAFQNEPFYMLEDVRFGRALQRAKTIATKREAAAGILPPHVPASDF